MYYFSISALTFAPPNTTVLWSILKWLWLNSLSQNNFYTLSAYDVHQSFQPCHSELENGLGIQKITLPNWTISRTHTQEKWWRSINHDITRKQRSTFRTITSSYVFWIAFLNVWKYNFYIAHKCLGLPQLRGQ